jgi:hypothetical protein
MAHKKDRTDWWVVVERIAKVLDWAFKLWPYIEKLLKWI